ncbi:DUF4351 domain-containing protein [Rugamonas sp. CCM 8940]|uniref:DUF4351 domain-containing protein n=1 Tax=Rugamonas sp. CCM 8940 TaxID=2765359 RepID=UPI0018F2912A|nr:DUF4351 domain-containing protein [Rugamonas sp. CCM 8940]MBJ7309149.1 DUF4351 domain-containing protein [Rugamonas sp. CCM 8940]
MATPDDDYDTPWKNAVLRYFPEFMAFYFPQAHAAIDWSRPHVFLDQELAQLVRDGELGRRRLDKLVRLATLAGGEQWVLLHLEVQGRRENAFAERIFCYNYRVYDRYRRPVASLVVLADRGACWRPSSFSYKLFGCRMGIDFPVVKLMDYAGRIEPLLDDPNPFALLTAAHLLTRQTKGLAHRRRMAKWRLTKLLYQRQWDRQRIIDLYSVIDWLMRLPPEMEARLWQGIVQMERRKLMPYLTYGERLGRKMGLEQGLREGFMEGRQEGQQLLLSQQLNKRFGPLPAALAERLAQADSEQLTGWAMALLDAASLDEVFGSK